jgi:hypothetical protein
VIYPVTARRTTGIGWSPLFAGHAGRQGPAAEARAVLADSARLAAEVPAG